MRCGWPSFGADSPYQLAMLEYFAEERRTTVSDVLTRELEGVASEHAEVLSAVVPGFAAALAGPDAGSPRFPADYPLAVVALEPVLFVR